MEMEEIPGVGGGREEGGRRRWKTITVRVIPA